MDDNGSKRTAMEAEELFAHVNDAIRQLATEGQEDETWQFLCECPDLGCHALVTLTLVEFDERRAASPPRPICANHSDDYRPDNGTGQEVSMTPFDGNPSADGS